ncbi:uncharacterized protein LOC116255872 [Nymphaea colorata]|uniref:uncharacterized protein LOC116255872 n=1 Tax=Nymphaea colorata TaxID=210225 RepID=UPI00129D8EB5|nr:uncharacterized protein LOC116255872 [Nymphaea colorata]
MATISEDALLQIIGAKIAKKAWEDLRRAYRFHSPMRIMLLKKELYLIKKESRDMVTYLDRIMFLANALAAAECHVADEELIQITLNGLPSGYENLIKSVSTSSSNTISRFPELYMLLWDQEKVVEAMQPKTTSTDNNSQVKLFVDHGRGRDRSFYHGGRDRDYGRSNQNGTDSEANNNNNINTTVARNRKSPIVCQYCDRKGHAAKDCWDILRAIYK